jgi:hypothetical protein
LVLVNKKQDINIFKEIKYALAFIVLFLWGAGRYVSIYSNANLHIIKG